VKTPDKYYFEKEYAKTKGTYWGLKPGKRLIYFEKLLKRHSKVLDLGCGDGRVALYLAKKGHVVTAMDISKTAISKLNTFAKKEKVTVNSFVGDLDKYTITEKYDAIVALFSLHFLSKSRFYKVVKNVKESTNRKGFNFIGVFRKPDKKTTFKMYYVREGELAEAYVDWKLVSHKEFVREENHGAEGFHVHKITSLIAQKR
jgi:tellurite methyltransferase